MAKASQSYYFGVILFYALIGTFISLRYIELIDSTNVLLSYFMIGLVAVAILSLIIAPPDTLSLLARRMMLMCLGFAQIKNGMDHNLDQNIKLRNLYGYTAIITDNNHTVTLPLTKYLITMNCEVILACQSMNYCNQLVQEIQLQYPNNTELISAAHLDIMNLSTVTQFVKTFKKQHNRLDYLINLASYDGEFDNNFVTTAQGLEGYFGANYFSHFALTQGLVDVLQAPLVNYGYQNQTAAKIINIAPANFVWGSLHPLLLSESGRGDFFGEYTNGTKARFRANLCNLLSSYKLQQNLDSIVASRGHKRQYRRVLSVAVDLGHVASHHPKSLKEKFIQQMYYRSGDGATNVLLHSILDILHYPGTFINSLKYEIDLFDYEHRFLPRHGEAYNNSKSMLYLTPSEYRAFGFAGWFWPSLKVLSDPASEEIAELSHQAAIDLVADRLYTVSLQMLKDWEASESFFPKRPTVGRETSQTDRVKNFFFKN